MRSPTIRRQGQSSPRRVNTPSRVNATFLTECSFGVAHDRLVEVITDVQPFEPYWESLSSVNLAGRKLDSVARLKEFLPKLDSLNLGIPSTVRTLSVASNTLTRLTSFGHLSNLENLDISYNDINSLQQLECLRHLRELRADGNKVSSLDGLELFDGLLKLSLEGNQLHEIDLTGIRWSRLELLNLSNNRLESVRGLHEAPSLISINLGMEFFLQDRGSAANASFMQKLRILRLSGNRLKRLDVTRFPNLRTLYVDNNCLADGRACQRGQAQKTTRQRLIGLRRLCKLENFSARNQSVPGMRDLGFNDVRDVKRLYLSGNPSPIPLGIDAQACYNLVYLELAACRLTTLPPNFSSIMPNIRALNLNYNFLETDEIARGLVGLRRLRKLTIVGNRMTGTKALVKVLNTMGQNIEMLDFRMNPCTLVWYLPLIVQDKDNGALLQPSEPPRGKHHSPHNPSHWEALDAQFRRGLPDKAYAGRLAYRGLIMRACPQIKILDGVRTTEKERRKAEALLKRVLKEAGVKGTIPRVLEDR
ncbi:L domain-like protein [Fomitiporia mediterranea MF3/22]|uniref:L domain-like protein n=1 Tax=Fomitiporia mediterranea (strain MF3/22) TaxID=694068 RepID=UPI0004409470|nr:L domain-like protein [Fomitiporia mediterranea MF3/22]EJC98028.1 L domain-like protein [Fomitiporia mediterranea MF3/22]